MPRTGPQSHVPSTATANADGWPLCVKCDAKLRGQFGGYGYNGESHFCTIRCAAEWAEIAVRTIT